MFLIAVYWFPANFDKQVVHGHFFKVYFRFYLKERQSHNVQNEC